LNRGSEEPRHRLPDAPTIGGSVRAALVDFYFNSLRLLGANGLWGFGLLALVFLLFTWPVAALVLLVLLALPTAGIFRLATLIVRDRPVAFGDALDAWRRFLKSALLTGFTLTAITVVLGTNVVVGFSSGQPLGWALATAAGWGLVATWAVAVPFWPLLLDPLRDSMPLLERLRLAATLVIVSPLRFGSLLVLVAALLVVSLVFFAAILTISVAFVALLTARFTLPAADRLEGRLTKPLPLEY
jgi:hypothetical protein